MEADCPPLAFSRARRLSRRGSRRESLPLARSAVRHAVRNVLSERELARRTPRQSPDRKFVSGGRPSIGDYKKRQRGNDRGLSPFLAPVTRRPMI